MFVPWAREPEVSKLGLAGSPDDQLFDEVLLDRVEPFDVGDVAADAQVIRIERDGVGQRRVVLVDALSSDDLTHLLRRDVDHSTLSTNDHLATAGRA